MIQATCPHAVPCQRCKGSVVEKDESKTGCQAEGGLAALRNEALQLSMLSAMGGIAIGPQFGANSARTVVDFQSSYAPGTIFIDTTERRLYLVTGRSQAIRYGIGVGRDGFGWAGALRVSAKREWPNWFPPAEMLARRPDLPRFMPGGLENPLGARALYLGSTLYRIHGSNEPETIGQAVSSGCFRMTNDDVIDLYNRVSVGATVIVR
jgi:lipoprotein-anchoring transpeptidase ErfK/SrfK